MSKMSMICQTIISRFTKSVGFNQADDENQKSVGKALLLVLNDGKNVLQTVLFAKDMTVRIYERKRLPEGDYDQWVLIGGQTSPQWWIILERYLDSKGANLRFQFDHYAAHKFGSVLVEEITEGFFIVQLNPRQIEAFAAADPKPVEKEDAVIAKGSRAA